MIVKCFSRKKLCIKDYRSCSSTKLSIVVCCEIILNNNKYCVCVYSIYIINLKKINSK